MADLDPIKFSLLELTLEIEQTPTPASKATAQKANFLVDTRAKSNSERRQNGERRQTIRFEADRRSGQDRRPHKPGWEQGTL